jgi:hypothetical protein
MSKYSDVISTERQRLGGDRLLRCSAMLGLALLCACARAPQPLVDNLIEGMDEQEVMKALGASKSAFHVVADVSLPKGDRRPPYSVKVVNADRVLCVGQLSDMSLSFYLKELHTVSCYPKDVDAMVDALIKAALISTRSREFSVVRGGVSIDSHEIDGRWCVSFVSERLSAKERRWNLRYS